MSALAIAKDLLPTLKGMKWPLRERYALPGNKNRNKASSRRREAKELKKF
jgi:hypothetical protein